MLAELFEPGSRVVLNSTEHTFIMLINVKMLTIVDIIYKHDKYNICEFKKASLFSDHHFIIMSS